MRDANARKKKKEKAETSVMLLLANREGCAKTTEIAGEKFFVRLIPTCTWVVFTGVLTPADSPRARRLSIWLPLHSDV